MKQRFVPSFCAASSRLKIIQIKFKEAVPKAEVLEQPQYFGKFQPLKS
jgi:hypothetical protein